MKYFLRREEELAIAGLLRAGGSGIRAALLEGPPGCGKTYLSQILAEKIKAEYVYSLLHSWSDDQELCCGVDVAAAVEGNASAVRQDGVLAVAARKSVESQTVLCLDEIDKTQERTEALLLDFLQTGRVPIKPGVHIQANNQNLIVMITSNGQRELSDALLRRVRRVRMKTLPVEVMNALVYDATLVNQGIITLASKAARVVAESEGTILSVQELTNLVGDLHLCEKLEDVQLLLAQWAARTAKGQAKAMNFEVATLWGEILKVKRRNATR